MSGIDISNAQTVNIHVEGDMIGGNRNDGASPTEPSPSTPSVRVHISRLDHYAPAELIGRDTELQQLNEVWAKVQQAEKPRPRILSYVALGGEGKTSLIAKWAAQMAAQDWPGCSAAFAWSFYSQGSSEQSAASSDLFLNEALAFFGDAAMAASAQGAHAKGQRLAELAGAHPALLLLDGLEPLQYPPASPLAGELRDQGIRALLKGLAANSRGLCLITTRYTVSDLQNYRQTTAPEIPLHRLSSEAGTALLRSLGVTGSAQEFGKLVEDVKGHALTLNLLGSWLRDAYHGDIRKRDLIRFDEADREELNGHAFRAIAAYADWLAGEGEQGQRALAILRLLGLFDRPATADCINALLKPPAIIGLTDPLFAISKKWLGLKKVYRPLDVHQVNLVLKRLAAARLLTVNRDRAGKLLSLDAHPLLREYFAKQLQQQRPEAWRAAHRTLFEHLRDSTQEGESPTLEALQPLYQAVAHGCLAGLQQEACVKVYRDRISKGAEAYVVRKLGAFGSDLGAVACFFDQPWSRPSANLAEADQAWLLNQAAFRLRALGRLTEAVEPMRAGMEFFSRKEDWKSAAIIASNLSELELTLGRVAAATTDGALAVDYADRSGDAFERMVDRTIHADALLQAGRAEQAAALFREAEVMQAEEQPGYPLLYSLPGFRYCDLLLAPAERAAWRASLSSPSGRGSEGEGINKTQGSLISSPHPSPLPEGEGARAACREVTERAKYALNVAETNSFSLLAHALDHLTLGRAALYGALLQGDPAAAAHPHITAAVDGLRRAGQSDYLPRGLLTRAWQLALCSEIAAAARDLDEAWEIAERGPMPLFLADIHLHRARLFHTAEDYPWQSPAHDLAEARRLIEQHGYGRRLPELEDAEAVIMTRS